MRYTLRWSSLFYFLPEDVSQHSCNVAMITHGLAVLKNERYHGNVDVGRAVVCALYHDAADVVVTHMIAPVKQHNVQMSRAVLEFHNEVNDYCIDLLPEIMRDSFTSVFHVDDDPEIADIISCADQVDALFKCRFEVERGNSDFIIPLSEIEVKLEKTSSTRPYFEHFLREFVVHVNNGAPYPRYMRRNPNV